MHAFTDHLPLTFLKTATKGQVAAWKIEELAGLDYNIRYRPGRVNPMPDALSRFPVLGPRESSPTGVRASKLDDINPKFVYTCKR